MINLKTHFFEATRQLAASKLRTFLAILGILVGTASVVAMVSIGKLAEEQILSQFKQLGINLLSVAIYPKNYNQSASSAHNSITLKQAEGFGVASKNIVLAAPYVSSYGQVRYVGHTIQASSVGVTPNMVKIAKLHLDQGRFLSFLDNDHYFCMVGQKVYNAIKKYNPNPIGSQISVGTNIFTIVGVLKTWPTNFFFNTNFNQAILLPIATSLSMQKDAKISDIALRIKSADLIDQTTAHIKTYVNEKVKEQRVMVRSPKSLIDSMQQSSKTMTILLALIGSISLIVGGIGIMNIMLVSVAERHREIGIRMAIGAKPKDIMWQFLIEAVVLSILGGVLGMLLGILVTFGVAVFKQWEFAFFMIPPLVGCSVTITVGVFFGWYPAWKASKLDPIQTLRSD